MPAERHSAIARDRLLARRVDEADDAEERSSRLSSIGEATGARTCADAGFMRKAQHPLALGRGGGDRAPSRYGRSSGVSPPRPPGCEHISKHAFGRALHEDTDVPPSRSRLQRRHEAVLRHRTESRPAAPIRDAHGLGIEPGLHRRASPAHPPSDRRRHCQRALVESQMRVVAQQAGADQRHQPCSRSPAIAPVVGNSGSPSGA